MRKLFLFLLLTTFLSYPAQSPSQSKTTIETLRDRGAIVERIRYRGEEYLLCVINADEGETEWFILTPSGNIAVCECMRPLILKSLVARSSPPSRSGY